MKWKQNSMFCFILIVCLNHSQSLCYSHTQGVKVGTLGRQNERNRSYVRRDHTSIFGLRFKSVCLMKLNCYSLIYSSLPIPLIYSCYRIYKSLWVSSPSKKLDVKMSELNLCLWATLSWITWPHESHTSADNFSSKENTKCDSEARHKTHKWFLQRNPW